MAKIEPKYRTATIYKEIILLGSNFQHCRLEYSIKKKLRAVFILEMIVTYYKYEYEMIIMVFSFLWMPSFIRVLSVIIKNLNTSALTNFCQMYL